MRLVDIEGQVLGQFIKGQSEAISHAGHKTQVARALLFLSDLEAFFLQQGDDAVFANEVAGADDDDGRFVAAG